MSAPVIVFETTIAARREDGGIAISLIDGSLEGGEAACVAILLCTEPTARVLVERVGSVLEVPEA